MATSNKSTGETLFDLTLYAVDTHANLSAQQENAKAKTTPATFGPGYETPLATYDLNTQSWKMYGDISLWGEQPSLVNLPPSGMTVNGVLFQQPAWEPITGATALSLWPTPTTQDHIVRKSTQQKLGSMHSVGLGDAVRMWPTPRAAMGETRNHTVYARSTDKPQNLENKVASTDSTAIGGKLNPMWVEWLMGFPTGWTDLEDLETL
jgi:hypothetical protein